MTATPYEVLGSELRCPRHGVTFARTASCAACVAEPGPRLDEIDEPLPPPPEGCLSSEEVERRLVEESDVVRAMRAELTGKRRGKKAVRDLHHYNTIAKLADVYVKLLRAAGEGARRREDEEIVRRRERRRADAERGEAN